MQFPHSCGYDTPRQKPYTHTYGGGREKNTQRSVGKVNNQPSILEYHVTNADDRSAPDASTFSAVEVLEVMSRNRGPHKAFLHGTGSGRRRSPAELQLGEFHSAEGNSLGGTSGRSERENRHPANTAPTQPSGLMLAR